MGQITFIERMLCIFIFPYKHNVDFFSTYSSGYFEATHGSDFREIDSIKRKYLAHVGYYRYLPHLSRQ